MHEKSREYRIACVWLPEFIVQVHRRIDIVYQDSIFAVVDRDHPQGVILAADRNAGLRAIVAGMRYAHAISLELELCAVEWSEIAMKQHRQEIFDLLDPWSPQIEICQSAEGVFWLEWSGLERLFGSIEDWAALIASTLSDAHWDARVGVGFGRRSSYAALCGVESKASVWIAKSPKEEQTRAHSFAIANLPIPHPEKVALERLGIRCLGDLQKIPRKKVHDRFGTELGFWHGLHREEDFGVGTRIEDTRIVQSKLELETPIRCGRALCDRIERLVLALMPEILEQGQQVIGVRLRLDLDKVWGKNSSHSRLEEICLAEPSRDPKILLSLIELRFEAQPPMAPVLCVHVQMLFERGQSEQPALFGEMITRDLCQGNEALARIRAELGNHAVQRAILCEEHLPEKKFRWEPYENLVTARTCTAIASGFVRRIEAEPHPMTKGEKEIFWGPFLIESDWWSQEIAREEVYLWRERGELVWAYYDLKRKIWFAQGAVG